MPGLRVVFVSDDPRPPGGELATAECRVDEGLHQLRRRLAQLLKTIWIRIVREIQRLFVDSLEDGESAGPDIKLTDRSIVDGHLQPFSTADLMVVVPAYAVETATKVPVEFRMVPALELPDISAMCAASDVTPVDEIVEIDDRSLQCRHLVGVDNLHRRAGDLIRAFPP